MKRRELFLSILLLVPGPLAACGGDDGSGEDTATETGDEESESSGTDESGGDGDAETGGDGDGDGEANCWDLGHTVVADIDETLTLADAEFFQQLQDSTYDPVEREGAQELIQGYYDRGYRVVYLTARALNQSSADDAMLSAEQLTREWLIAHEFPFDDNTRLEMADSLVFGDSAAEYKSARLMQLQGEGYMFDYAYGNATSDITAYENAGIDKAATFIIGEEAGVDGTVAIEGEGWVDHTAAHLPAVMDWCADAGG
jgi:hypothetical protein